MPAGGVCSRSTNLLVYYLTVATTLGSTVVLKAVWEDLIFGYNYTDQVHWIPSPSHSTVEYNVFFRSRISNKIVSPSPLKVEISETLPMLYVLIKNLTVADSGLYWCVLSTFDHDSGLSQTVHSRESLWLIVTDPLEVQGSTAPTKAQAEQPMLISPGFTTDNMDPVTLSTCMQKFNINSLLCGIMTTMMVDNSTAHPGKSGTENQAELGPQFTARAAGQYAATAPTCAAEAQEGVHHFIMLCGLSSLGVLSAVSIILQLVVIQKIRRSYGSPLQIKRSSGNSDPTHNTVLHIYNDTPREPRGTRLESKVLEAESQQQVYEEMYLCPVQQSVGSRKSTASV